MNSSQQYDKYQRDQESRAFYKSRFWEKCRQLILNRDNHLCQECLKQDKLTPADMVHHKTELKDEWSKRFEPDNLISLCNSCHNKQHPEKGKRRKKEKISEKIKILKSEKNPEIF